MKTNFSHSGTFGDVLYSLNFLYDYCEEFGIDKINFHIQKDVPTRAKLKNHPGNGVQLNEKMIEFMIPLLKNIPVINKVTTSGDVPKNYFNLDIIRDMGYSLGRFDIKAFYYGVFPYPVKRNMGRKILHSEFDERAKDKIIVFRSQRYNIANLNYKILDKLKSKVILLGTDFEKRYFYAESFTCKHIQIKDFQEAANLIGSASFVVGNQTGLFAIAEQLKVPRVLESWQQGPNVVCEGGLCYEGINPTHFNKAIESMVKKYYGTKR